MTPTPVCHKNYGSYFCIKYKNKNEWFLLKKMSALECCYV